jgi:hypothetical protein
VQDYASGSARKQEGNPGAARKLDVLASIGPKVVCYAGSGHDGNRNLRDRDPNEFLFTILQRTSPDMERGEIALLESSWKDRLQTRDYGLNDN